MNWFANVTDKIMKQATDPRVLLWAEASAEVDKNILDFEKLVILSESTDLKTTTGNIMKYLIAMYIMGKEIDTQEFSRSDPERRNWLIKWLKDVSNIDVKEMMESRGMDYKLRFAKKVQTTKVDSAISDVTLEADLDSIESDVCSHAVKKVEIQTQLLQDRIEKLKILTLNKDMNVRDNTITKLQGHLNRLKDLRAFVEKRKI